MQLVDETLDEPETALQPETDWGRIEYKRKLVGITGHRRCQLITQMRWRLSEGKGVAEYNIGVDDDGCLCPLSEQEYKESLETIMILANEASADAQKLHIKRYPRGVVFTIHFVVRSSNLDEYRWVVIGESGVGKTTLIGCLLDRLVDDGNGSVRNRRLRHLHELDTGCSTQPMISYKEVDSNSMVLALIDLPSADRYLPSTLVRVLAYRPNGVLHVVRSSAASVESQETGVFSTLVASLATSGVPCITVCVDSFTSSDNSASSLDSSTTVACNPLKKDGCTALYDRLISVSHHCSDPAWPIAADCTVVTICESMESLDIGLVLHGVVANGSIKIGDNLRIAGSETIVTISSLHRYKKPVQSVDSDTSVSFTVTCDSVQNLHKVLYRSILISSHMDLETTQTQALVTSCTGTGMSYLLGPYMDRELCIHK